MMQDFPFFYADAINTEGSPVEVPEETAKHIVQVLRMKEGEYVYLTNGKGSIALSEISGVSKKRVTLIVNSVTSVSPQPRKVTIAVSLLKNNSRFEWLLEKATELGISSIIPVICTRTEKQHFRYKRMEGIIMSAMLQSRQAWLPELPEPISFMEFIENDNSVSKYIAWCGEGEKKILNCGAGDDTSICIGPEGDFTPGEIQAATEAGYTGVSLGNNRLRSETAAITAAVMLTR